MTEPIFKKSFHPYASPGDSISAEVDGFTIIAEVEQDNDSSPLDDDGHGVLVHTTSASDKQPGWRLINKDRHDAIYYDVPGTIAKARQEGWGGFEYRDGDGIRPYRKLGLTYKQCIAELVEQDFNHLRGWYMDEWVYVGVHVHVLYNGIRLTHTHDHSTWGLSSEDWQHVQYYAEEEAEQALELARQNLIASLTNPHVQLVAINSETSEFLTPQQRGINQVTRSITCP